MSFFWYRLTHIVLDKGLLSELLLLLYLVMSSVVLHACEVLTPINAIPVIIRAFSTSVRFTYHSHGTH